MSIRELGLLSILLMWSASAFLLIKWRGKKSMSMSRHAASTRSAFYSFAILQMAAVSLFAIFIFQWLIPQRLLGLGFQVLFTITICCLYATLLTPDNKGYMRRFHRFFAYTMAALLAVLVSYIIIFSHLHLITALFGSTVVLYMTYCLISFALYKKSPSHFVMRNYLILQVTYLVSFQVFILLATYLG